MAAIAINALPETNVTIIIPSKRLPRAYLASPLSQSDEDGTGAR